MSCVAKSYLFFEELLPFLRTISLKTVLFPKTHVFLRTLTISKISFSETNQLFFLRNDKAVFSKNKLLKQSCFLKEPTGFLRSVFKKLLLKDCWLVEVKISSKSENWEKLKKVVTIECRCSEIIFFQCFEGTF